MNPMLLSETVQGVRNTKPDPAALLTISAALEQLEQDTGLHDADNSIGRMRALDLLDALIMEGAEWVEGSPDDAQIWSLVQRAAALQLTLTTLNTRLFAQLIHSVQRGERGPLRQYFISAARQLATAADEPGYDELDTLLGGLLETDALPATPQALDPDMVFYQPTPARIILKLIDLVPVTAKDTFYDIGSGLGQVPILVHLLTGAKTRGVEIEAAYARYADACLTSLNLSAVEFLNADARHVDYADGSIFYLYTPFGGEILRHVLAKLEAVAAQRPISVCTYGPCTLYIAKEAWLRPVYQSGSAEACLGIFSSE